MAKCEECGKPQGSDPYDCDVCWQYAMDELRERDEAARDRETDRQIDEARGK